MTTLKQIEANRRNALKSTGPKTEDGKRRSRRNALRHGLTAETVVETLEDARDYRQFEVAIASAFDAETAVERELVLRLASLLWRLRRATGIETGLLQTQRKQCWGSQHNECEDVGSPPVEIHRLRAKVAAPVDNNNEAVFVSRSSAPIGNQQMAAGFQQLADKGNTLDRLNRYETALWRQVAQLLFMLNFLRRPVSRRISSPQLRHNLLPFGRR